MAYPGFCQGAKSVKICPAIPPLLSLRFHPILPLSPSFPSFPPRPFPSLPFAGVPRPESQWSGSGVITPPPRKLLKFNI